MVSFNSYGKLPEAMVDVFLGALGAMGISPGQTLETLGK
jgi:hypothetical protein